MLHLLRPQFVRHEFPSLMEIIVFVFCIKRMLINSFKLVVELRNIRRNVR